MGHWKPAMPPRKPDMTRGPATPPRWPDEDQGIGHAQRRPDGTQGTSHAPTAAKNVPKHLPRFHSNQTGPGGPARRPQWPDKNRETGHAPWRPDVAQETSHAFTATRRGQGDWTRPHGGKTKPRRPATPQKSQTRHRGPATPPQQPDGAQRAGHAPTAPRFPKGRPRPTMA